MKKFLRSSFFVGGFSLVLLASPTDLGAQLTPSGLKMIEGCRAGDRNECWRASQFIYEPNPELMEAKLKGCDLKSDLLCKNAAITYERGSRSVSISPDLAAKYYKLACDLGDHDSCSRLGNLQGPAASTMAAANLQTNKSRCQSGDGVACNMAGFLLATTQVGNGNEAAALAFYRRGCQLGVQEACSNASNAQAASNLKKRNAERLAADNAARKDPARRFGAELSQADRSCLQDVTETYFTSERGQCTSYSRLPSGSEGCDRYATVDVKRYSYKLKNICVRPISVQEYCGNTPFGWATLLQGDVYTRQFSSPCRIAY